MIWGRWAAVAAIAFLTVSPSGSPPAHAKTVVRSVPANGAALAEPPGEVALFFDREPDPRLSHVAIRGPGDSELAINELTVVKGALTAGVSVTDNGDYVALYHAVFTDGSDLFGAVQFSVGTGTPPVPIPAAVVAERAREIVSSHGHGVDAVSAVLLFLNLLVVVVVIVLLRLNRPGRRRVGWSIDRG